MSNRSPRRRAAGLALASALTLPPVAAAQSVAEYARRVDSLGKIWHAQADALAAADSDRRSRAMRDTIRVGHFVIVADTEYVPIARAAAERVTPMLDGSYGRFAAKLESRIFTVRRGAPPKGDTTHVVQTGILDDRGLVAYSSLEPADAGSLSRSWQTKAAALISGSLSSELRTWLDQTIPIEGLTQTQIDADRVELILTGSEAAHECAMGSVPRCLQALALTPVSDPAFELFNRDQRGDMIERNAMRFRRADPARYSRCTVDHAQATCDSLVRDIPLDAVPLAAPVTMRRSVVRYALQQGGPGAFDRLANAEGSVGDRIAAAARMPIDSVVRGWRGALMESQSVSKALDMQTALSAVAWAAACCALALRSSRWR